MTDNTTIEKGQSRVRRARGAARSRLDVMLTEAAAGGPRGFLAPGSGVKIGLGLMRHPRQVAARTAGLAAQAALERAEEAPSRCTAAVFERTDGSGFEANR